MTDNYKSLDMSNPLIREKVFDAVVQSMHYKRMSYDQILQWARNNCPCEKCSNSRKQEQILRLYEKEGEQ